MVSEVGSARVSIVPSFKGFRSGVTSEAGASVKSAASIFAGGFRKAGAEAGGGFKRSFADASKGLTSAALKTATAEVSRASKDLSAVRLKEQDATGKVRVAEALLADVRKRYASDSGQVVRAEERLMTAQRNHITQMSGVKSATDRLATSQRNLATATESAAKQASSSGGAFARLPSIFGRSGSEGASAFGSSFKSGIGTVFAGAFLANIATSAARGIGEAIGTTISSGISYGLQGVNLASDLEQSTGAVESVFKDQASIITGFSSKAATNVGLSQTKYQKFATVVGAQLKNLGIPFDQIGGKTNDLITLGADLAAQFGGDTSTAVGALSSLLRGERDPIEQYGVSLKQVDIDAQKAAMGMDGLTGEADKQAEIQATLALLWQQTGDAQGTFMDEQDTYAGRMQVLNAELEDAQTRLGTALLPTFTAAATYANDVLVPALEDVISRFGPKLAGALETAGPKFETLLTKAEPLLEKVGDFVVGPGLDGLIDSMDYIADHADEWGGALKIISDGLAADFAPDGVAGAIPGIIDGLDKFSKGDAGPVAGGVDWFVQHNFGDDPDSQATVFNWGVKLGTAAGEGIIAGADSRGSGVYGAGENLGAGYAGGIDLKKPAAFTSGADLKGESIAGAGGGYGPMLSNGENAGDGYAQGIRNRISAGESAAKDLAAAAYAAAQREDDSHSPSRKYAKLGGYAGDGYALGIRERTFAPVAAMRDMASATQRAAGMVFPHATAPVGTAAVSGGPVPSNYTVNITNSEIQPVVAARMIADEFVRLSAG